MAFQLGERTFRFTQLPFGFSLVPRVFTKIIKVLATKLAEKGVKIFMYLDNWMVAAPSQPQATKDPSLTIQTIESMGFLVNEEKLVLTPT